MKLRIKINVLRANQKAMLQYHVTGQDQTVRLLIRELRQNAKKRLQCFKIYMQEEIALRAHNVQLSNVNWTKKKRMLNKKFVLEERRNSHASRVLTATLNTTVIKKETFLT